MKWSDALVLGRVSNLPTVWTNTLAGVALAGGALTDPRVVPLLVAFSLCYVAGMFLNDAFDREFDRQHRPERPIPAGRATAASVFGAGFGLLAVGVALLAWVGLGFEGGTGWRPLAGGLTLAVAIVFYDANHKANAWSPLVMGLCRMLVYLTAGYAVIESPPAGLVVASLLLLAYLIGLTYIARQEHLGRIGNLWPLGFLGLPIAWGAAVAGQGVEIAAAWLLFAGWVAYSLHFLKRRRPGDVPRAVGSLLAGICLWDALVIASTGNAAVALLAAAMFLLTLVLQRYVAPT